jgi:serine/threonine-protein kinase
MGATPVVPFRPGDVLAGKFRVLRVVGAGGMGAVVEAYHTELEQHVALKVMLPEVARKSDLATRFVREARASSKLQGEHVAKVYDVGKLPTGEPYIVMEYLEGEDLANVVRTRGAQPIEHAVDWVLQACEAIGEAHTKGVIHRDLKPSNVFMAKRPDGTALVKVLDFGISKVLSDDGTNEGNLTNTSAMLGSPAYMSPEQMRDAKSVDGRTDVWGLGMILYELLAGKPVFQADSVAGLIAMIASDPVRPLREHRPDIPEGLDLAVLACLAKTPAKRVQNVAELAASLEPFASLDGTASARRTVRIMRSAGMTSLWTKRPGPLSQQGTAVAVAASDRTSSTFGVTAHHGRRRAPIWLLAVGGFVLVGGAAAFWWSTRTPSAEGDDAAAVSSSDGTSVPVERATVEVAAQPVVSSPPPDEAVSGEPPVFPSVPPPSSRKAGASSRPPSRASSVPTPSKRPPGPPTAGTNGAPIDLSERR